MLPIAILLLAAGGSSRLGRPKQLLPFGSGTLLRHAAETALATALGPAVVVLGAAEEECREALHGLPVTILTNARWQHGMGGSIAAGMRAVDEGHHRAVLITLCDQPGITVNTLLRLDDHQRSTGKSVIASRYSGIAGPPALFTARHFPELRLLQGDRGARALLQDEAIAARVDCPEARFDIDTEEDAARMPAGRSALPSPVAWSP